MNLTPNQALADASKRLRGRPGRPSSSRGDNRGDNDQLRQRQAAVVAALFADRPQAKLALAPPERPGITARRLYSRRQAAAYLSASVDTVDRLADRGQLPRLRLPGSRLVRFDIADLEQIVLASRP
jgi:excisionase family DNA binding protein